MKKLDGISTIEWKVKISEGNEKQLKWLFSKIDADGSGDIDIGEMKAALQDDEIRREMGVGKDQADKVFAEIDEATGSAGSTHETGILWDQFKAWFCTKQDLASLM